MGSSCKSHDGKRWGVHVNLLPPRGSLLIVPPGANELMGGEVSPALALAWALLVETDAGPVDVGPCPDAPQCEGGMADSGGETPWGYPISIPCPACNGTGRETIPVARLLLDAASGDASARDRLLVHADQLQAEGDPRGELLALALGPWSAPGPTLAAELEASPMPAPCGRNFSGTAAALRWLEWLTWAREFDAGYAAALSAGIVTSRGELEALARAGHRGWVEGTAMPAHLLAGR